MKSVKSASAFKLKELVPTEKQEHRALIAWAERQPRVRDYLIHIANEYDGGVRGGFQRKLLGVKAGVSDLFLAIPSKGKCGLWIELKRKVGYKKSDEQIGWITQMKSLGYEAAFCYGCDDAVKLISEYLDIPSL